MNTQRTFIVLSLAGSLLAAACKDPSEGKVQAEVSAPAAETSAAVAPGAATKTYAFAAPDSKLEFTGSKVTGKHDGSFGKFNGTIVVPNGKVEEGTVTVDVDANSMTTDNEKLTGHLKSADFFDTEKHPVVRFKSTSIKPGAADGKTHTVTGNLELHGVTKAVTFPATIHASPDMVHVAAEFTINRKDWGINYAGKADDLIRDGVVIRLDIKGKPTG